MTAAPPPDPGDRIAALEQEVATLKASGGVTGRLLRYLPWMAAGHLLIGAPALLISLVVAYGTFEQADATRNIQRATAWPHVSFGTSNISDTGARDVTFTLTNQGVGPALVGPVELRYRGRPMRSTGELLRTCCGATFQKGTNIGTATSSNIVIRPGQELRFIDVPDRPINAPVLARLERQFADMSAKVCFCSVFDECWTIEGRQSKPQPVAQCPTNWVPFRER